MANGTSDALFPSLTKLIAGVTLVLVLICLIVDVAAAFWDFTFRSRLLEVTKVLVSLPAVVGGFALVFQKPISARLRGTLQADQQTK